MATTTEKYELCTICLEKDINLVDKKDYYGCTCDSYYHLECWKEYIMKSRRCPICDKKEIYKIGVREREKIKRQKETELKCERKRQEYEKRRELEEKELKNRKDCEERSFNSSTDVVRKFFNSMEQHNLFFHY